MTKDATKGSAKKKLSVKKESVKNLDVKAKKQEQVKGGGTKGCLLTFKSTGQSSC